jgi:hypothetical protein
MQHHVVLNHHDGRQSFNSTCDLYMPLTHRPGAGIPDWRSTEELQLFPFVLS